MKDTARPSSEETNPSPYRSLLRDEERERFDTFGADPDLSHEIQLVRWMVGEIAAQPFEQRREMAGFLRLLIQVVRAQEQQRDAVSDRERQLLDDAESVLRSFEQGAAP
jgi:hypothetical protein